MKKFIMVAFLVILTLFLITALILVSVKLLNKKDAFTLINESGTVQYKRDAGDEYITLESDEKELTDGNFVKTSDNSFAHIIFPNNSVVSIDENTEVQINFSQNQTTIEQFLGNTWHRVKSISGEEESYEVKTLNTVAAVRGTIFAVGIKGGGENFESNVLVEENEIIVSTLEKKDGDVSRADTKKVTAGKIIRSIGEEKPQLHKEEDIADTMKTTYWYRRNKIIDRLHTQYKDYSKKDFLREITKGIREDEDLRELINDSQDLSLPGFLSVGNMMDSLLNQYDLKEQGSSFCQSTNKQELEASLSYLEMYYQNYPELEEVKVLFQILIDACADGVITNEEIQKFENVN